MMQLSLNDLHRSAIMATALIFLGCSHTSAQENSAVATAPQAVLPSPVGQKPANDWRNDIGTFKIGLVRGWSSDMSRLALARVESVFATALRTPVKVVVFERFTSLMDAQADGRIDLAAYSARAFATVQLMCECVEALAAPANSTGQTGQVAILAGDKARLSNLAGLGAAKLGRIASASIAGRDMLLGNLMINGKPVTGKEEFWADFPDIRSAVNAYNANQIDGFVIPAAASSDGVAEAGKAELDSLSQSAGGGSVRPAAAVWRSAFWPYGPIAVRNNLAAEAKSIILQTLKQLDVTNPQAHAILSEGLAGAFRKSERGGFNAISASIRLLVSQNANWR